MKASSLTWFLLSLFSVCIIMSTVSQKTCWDEKYTSASCHKLFCPPWLRCVDGKCICKLPYQCPRNKTFGVCTQANRQFLSYCQLKSAECTNPLYRFSSVSPCTDAFQMSLRNKEGKPVTKKGIVKIKLPNHQNESFVCTEKWTITEANVACRQLDFPQGASHEKFQYGILEVDQKQPDCLDVSCKGSETTLAECTLKKGKGGKNRAGVTCYKETKECADNQFTCVNGKCILSEMTCNGENDCGDLSDELCCTECKQGFHCKSDICIPESYVCNGELDCIRGEDELNCKGEELEKPTVTPAGRSEKSENNDGDELQKLTVTSAAGSENSEKNDVGTNAVNYSIDAERKRLREIIPSLNCGVPVENTAPKRVKRIIGGQNAEKNQFPWQVAIKDGTKVNCGGIYIGGCWVLSAAHCVRADQPQKYRIIVELLDRLSYDQDIDSFPVKSVKVHEFYNPSTYENDIALLEVVNIYNKPTCMQVENNLVPACVPWSPHQFKAGETCTVSGWGRAEGLSKVFHLKWGHIKLMNNCSSVYKERFLDKMECAGTYDGSIDACKGDSGGPLICYDANKVGYVWGIVSWGENCGVAGYPGVYTKVAQYFEWISRHVGRQLISKYNI